MVQDQELMEELDEDDGPPPRYQVDLGFAADTHRSLGALTASRRCYSCQQEDEEPPSPSTDPQAFIDRIVDHCAATTDYLLPDTPLKEAIFRMILAEGNSPIMAEEISAILTEKWAMTPYPRDISPQVIRKLLDRGQAYCITSDRGPSGD